MTLNEIYTAQSYLERSIVADKRSEHDYVICVALMPDDDRLIPVMVDGHHSLEAARLDNVEPTITIVPCEHKSLEEYVIAFNDLSNPINIITKEEL